MPVVASQPPRWIAPNRVAPGVLPIRHVLRTGAPLPHTVLHV
ncbi:hypothetical protein P6B95_37445 [Streptomyces atratus]|nr:hypothetical protein [Streptomyces atratus]WPW32499.1 hypothetical protein P6B95_37445 [Streptomyces atratus]